MEFSAKNFSIIFFLIIVALGLWAIMQPRQVAEEPVPCTAEALICPDGSSVGRTGPKCEFAQCPALNIPDTWQATTSAGFSFRYPANFGTTYVKPVDWPPQIEQVPAPFECTQAGLEEARAGQTEQRAIGARSYCVTTLTEGAAGTIYKQYAHAVTRGVETLILTWSLRQPQCANYNDPERSACESEVASFSPDNLIDKIVSSIE
jgi:hypothetical protein